MVGEDEAAAWLALRAAPGIGDVAGRRLVGAFGTPAAALAARAADLTRVGLSPAFAAGLAQAACEAARTEVRRTVAAGARLIPYTDVEYPSLLRQLPDAPLVLVARGEPLVDGPTLAIVGARHATRYGRDVATVLAEGLAHAGVTVVSGLARGIDGTAHEAALRAGGPTVAVLGCGIDVIYPAEHAALAARIMETGTLLSERNLGDPPLPEYFPARNRIIAGMAHGTLVVEAAERSGSLITARCARDYNREVFAVPGRIESPLSVGTHGLIQQGAKLVTSLDDIVSEIAPALRARAASGPCRDAAAPRGSESGETGEPLLPLLAAGPLGVDELIRETRLPAATVLARVLDLELRGVIVQLPGKQFQIARG
jgi:DNA processing protein